MSRNALKNISRLIDVEERPANEAFLDDLKRSIEITEEKSWTKLPSQTFKPSSMTCHRNSYYQIIGAPTDKGQASFNMVGICNAGSDIHVRIQTAIIGMKDNSMDCEWVDIEKFIEQRGLKDLEVKSKTETETKLYNKKYNISFMCDGIIKYKNKYYIVELKTETANKWYSRTGVDPKHYNQATAYSLSFKLDNVLFVYISRDMLDMKCFMFNVTDEMRNNLVMYMENVNEYVSMHIPPPVIMENRKCQYCNYSEQCRKDGQK